MFTSSSVISKAFSLASSSSVLLLRRLFRPDIFRAARLTCTIDDPTTDRPRFPMSPKMLKILLPAPRVFAGRSAGAYRELPACRSIFCLGFIPRSSSSESSSFLTFTDSDIGPDGDLDFFFRGLGE